MKRQQQALPETQNTAIALRAISACRTIG